MVGSNGFSLQEKSTAVFASLLAFGSGLLRCFSEIFDVVPEGKVDYLTTGSHLITLAFLHDDVEGSLLIYRYEDQPPCVRLARHQCDPWGTSTGVGLRGKHFYQVTLKLYASDPDPRCYVFPL